MARPPSHDPRRTAWERISPTGDTQAGVARPMTPQRCALVSVGDAPVEGVPSALESISRAILELVEQPDVARFPNGTGNLTVLVGLGPRALGAFPRGRPLAHLLALPTFRGDDVLPEHRLGGDILLSVHADDPAVLSPVTADLLGLIPGYAPRWSDRGFRGPGTNGIARNPFGYLDGFAALSPADQDAVIGRRRHSGAPSVAAS